MGSIAGEAPFLVELEPGQRDGEGADAFYTEGSFLDAGRISCWLFP